MVPSAGNPQALNRYSYMLNNPLKYVDPSGHAPSEDDEEGNPRVDWKAAMEAARQAGRVR